MPKWPFPRAWPRKRWQRFQAFAEKLTSAKVYSQALCALIALTFLDVSPVVVGGSYLRFYQLLSLLLLPLLLVRARGAKRQPVVLAASSFTALVVASNFWTSSASDTRLVSFGQIYLLTLFLGVLTALNLGILTAQKVLLSLAVGATTCSAVAMVQFALAELGIATAYTLSQSGIPWSRPPGTMREPDWAGLVAGMGLIIALTWRLRRRWRLVLLLVNGAAFVITYVRTAFVALFITLILIVILPGARRQARRAFAVAAASVIAFVAAVSLVSPAFTARLDPRNFTAGVDGGAAHSRLAVIHFAIDQGKYHWLIGHGAGSINAYVGLSVVKNTYGGGGELNGGHGSANLLATTFFDLGLLGLSLVIVLMLATVICAMARRGCDVATLAMTIFLLLSFMFSNGVRFAFVWILFAVTASEQSQGAYGPKTLVTPTSSPDVAVGG